MSFRYKASRQFWRNFYRLPAPQKESVREAWKIFKIDPFDPRLRTHKIERLSGIWKTTVYSVIIEGDLRVIFRIENDLVWTMNIGTHSVYEE